MRTQITEQVSRFDFAEAAQLSDFAFQENRRRANTAHARRITEAARLIAGVATGQEDPFLLRQAFRPTEGYAVRALCERYPGLMLREAPIGGMSISDFSILTIDVLDRVLYGYYNTIGIVSLPLVKEHPLRDFRLVSRYLIDGATDPPELVAPGAEPKEKKLSQEPIIQYQPAKYEAFCRVVWEAMVNDDLGMFNDLAQRLAIGANRGIEMFLTGLYVDANGPHASLYKTGFTNQIITANGAASNNPPLSIQGIQDAYKVLARMKDPDGFPIVITGKKYLWYGPGLVATAENLMHMLSSQISVAGGTVNAQGFPSQFVEVNNWAVQNMSQIMNPFIPIVCTAAGTQDTMWGLTMDQGAQNRPAIEFGYLNGFRTPQIFQKVPNTMRAGGGVDPTLGDFYTMSHEIKVLSVYGGKQVDGHSTVASTGQAV